MGACSPARAWASDYNNWKDVIRKCDSPNWLLWLIEELNIIGLNERRMLACHFVRDTPLSDGRKLWDLLDEPSQNAVNVSERYAKGMTMTLEEFTNARMFAQFAAAEASTSTAKEAAKVAVKTTDHIVTVNGMLGNLTTIVTFAAWDAAGNCSWNIATPLQIQTKNYQLKTIRDQFGDRIIDFLNERYPVQH